MKKLLFFLLLLTTGLVSIGQGIPFPVYQPQGNAQTRWSQQGAVQGMKGIINGVFPDTSAANNTTYIDFYPGSQIVTTTGGLKLWLRDNPAVRWINVTNNVTNFTFNTDSSLVICYSNGSCDTIPIYNFNTVVNNIVQNFIDSSFFQLNDTTLIICNAAGSCDTIHLGNTNNYFFLNDSTLVTCDTLETVCVGDSCYQQQICDTIPIPIVRTLVFQNGLRKLPNTNIVELGNDFPGEGGTLVYRNTWIYGWGSLTVQGKVLGAPPFAIDQSMIVEESPSVQSWFHVGKGYSSGIDNPNTVGLYMNYTDPFAIMTQGALSGDTVGFMGDRIGYFMIGNGKGSRYALSIDNSASKQAGLMIHTLDTANTDGVTIFAQQTPSAYPFSVNPPTDSTLLTKRVAVFKTNQQQQNPAYGDGNFSGTPTYIAAFDVDGNIIEYPPGGLGGGGLLFARDDARNNSGGNMYFSNATHNMGWDSIGTFNISTSAGTIFDGKINMDEGVDVAAGTTINIGNGGNTFTVTGTATVDCIYSTGWQDGSVIYLVFTGTPTLLHNSAALCGGSNLYLAGATNFAITSQTTMAFVKKDTYWVEISRAQSSGAGITGITADNGLTASSATNVQLGQAVAGSGAALLSNREIPMANFTLNFNADAAQTNNLINFRNQAGNVGARITDDAEFSNSLDATGSEKFGAAAVATGQSSVSVGNLAQASGSFGVAVGSEANSGASNSNTAIGRQAIISGGANASVLVGASTSTSGSSSVLIGSGATSTVASAVGVGFQATVTGSGGITIGQQSTVGHQASIAIGFGATTTAANQVVIGAAGLGGAPGAQHFYFGSGVVNTAANNADVDFNICGGSGTDVAGVNWYFGASKATGNAIGGNITHQTSVPVASGTTLQTLGDRQAILGKYTTLTEATATAFARANVPSGTVAGGTVVVTVEANDATDYQSRTLRIVWSAVNKAGTTTITISTPEEVVAVSAGTLTVTLTAVDSGSGNVDFKADATSSLTQTVLRANCMVTKNFGTGAITSQ